MIGSRITLVDGSARMISTQLRVSMTLFSNVPGLPSASGAASGFATDDGTPSPSPFWSVDEVRGVWLAGEPE